MTNTQQAHMTPIKTELPPGTFESFALLNRELFASRMAQFGPQLFVVDLGRDELNEKYLDSFEDAGERQHHNCSACRHFLRLYGNLAFVTETGELVPALWFPNGSGLYAKASDAMYRAVQTGQIKGVFLAKEAVFGKPEAGGYNHFALDNPAVYRHAIMSANQRSAELTVHYGAFWRALLDFTPEVVDKALELIEGDALTRSEKIAGPAKFLKQTHEALAKGTSQRAKDNILWKQTALAPVGFATPRGSVIGPLLEDLLLMEKGELTLDVVKKKFADKMHPLQYRRPTSLPTAGGLLQAQKLVAQMGLEPAFERRHALLEDIPTLWEPKGVNQPVTSGGATVHPISFAAFRENILPKAIRMAVLKSNRMDLCAMVTAVDRDAPPLLQWDDPEARNPVSWYRYHGQSEPGSWTLSGSAFRVMAVALKPPMWGSKVYENQGVGGMFVLEGARDQRGGCPGLFPECLRSELSTVRKVIEQHNNSAKPAMPEGQLASGVGIGKNGMLNPVMVETVDGVVMYQINSWG